MVFEEPRQAFGLSVKSLQIAAGIYLNIHWMLDRYEYRTYPVTNKSKIP